MSVSTKIVKKEPIDDDDDDKPISSLMASAKKESSSSSSSSLPTPKKSSSSSSSSTTTTTTTTAPVKVKSEPGKSNDNTNNNQIPKVKTESSSSSSSSSSSTAVKTTTSSSSANTSGAVSDSDDDLPLAEVMRKRIIKIEKHKQAEAQAKAQPPAKKPKREEDSSSKKVSKEASSKSISRGTGGSVSAEFYESTLKGALVQKLLVRWWYAWIWPLPEEIGTPPPGYEKLDGFPGVFVSTRTDSLGTILDLRDKTNCPSLKNMITKPSSELKELCRKAYENQIQQLIEAEGEDVKLVRVLKRELKELMNIDAKKADAEGMRYQNSITKTIA